MRHREMIVALLTSCLAGCSGAAVSLGDGPVTGAWGGVHAGLALTAVGGTITYDCAHGSIALPLVRNSDGAFDVAGFHVREQGGPVRIDQVPDSLPARYIGQISGDRMTLRVVVGTDTLGPFDLRLGATPQLFRCL